MKVLEPGTGQKGWSTEAICTGKGNKGGGCGAKLLVEAKDIYYTYHHDYGGGTDTFTTFSCCECGVKTDLQNVPPSAVQGFDPDKKKSRDARD